MAFTDIFTILQISRIFAHENFLIVLLVLFIRKVNQRKPLENVSSRKKQLALMRLQYVLKFVSFTFIIDNCDKKVTFHYKSAENHNP